MEILFFLTNNKKIISVRGCRRGALAIKLDMIKAHDRVEWEFLCRVMVQLGFSV